MRVLLDTRERHFDQNSYIRDLVRQLDDVQIDGFSWKRLLLGRYDIFHVHWPEWLVTHTRTALVAPMQILTALAILKLNGSRTAIVRTMHNRGPHRPIGRIGMALVKRIEAITYARIWLNDPRGDARTGPNDVVIPHPDYRPWAERTDAKISAPPNDRRALCFGSLAPYRQFEVVARAMTQLDNGVLTISGSPADEEYVQQLSEYAKSSPQRITIYPHRLSDFELAAAIQAADVVFVPYEDLYNSGIVFLSLTLQRPVALAESPAAAALAEEYGAAWIRQWQGELGAAALAKILDQSHPSYSAESERRTWTTVANQHRLLYRTVAR
jgi:beta-1,4-mannosyltransferase